MAYKNGASVLLVFPKFPPSYWGFNYALDVIGKKSCMAPLGLLTVAALFPSHYSIRVIDLNVEELTDEHIAWADVVFTSAMIVQKKSLRAIIGRCNRARTPVVAGGPYPTSYHDEIFGVDHFILGEVEDIFPVFLEDFENGRAQRLYRAPTKPDVTKTPVPRYDLIDIHAYASLALQFSRGCPFNCEFCDITKLFGRVSRTKSNQQMLAEFDSLYNLGWRGPVFVVDDNFIGNKREAMRLLPALAAWQKEREYPFSLFTEASVNLVELSPLMDMMVDAGFYMVFLGIESPNPEALRKTKKGQNVKEGANGYLLHAVRTLQGKGLEVAGGFILGLDGDSAEVFDAQVQFIQNAGIPMATVGLLTALKGTDLYERLEKEGRITKGSSGNNVDIALNFEPEINKATLIDGYKRVLRTLYDPTLTNYFRRCWDMLENLKPTDQHIVGVGKKELRIFASSARRQLLSKQGPAYFKFLAKTALRRWRMLPAAVRLAITGYHFERLITEMIAVSDFRRSVRAEYTEFEKILALSRQMPRGQAVDLGRYAEHILDRVHSRYEKIDLEFRDSASDVWRWFKESLTHCLYYLDEIKEFQAKVSIFQHLFEDELWEAYVKSRGYSTAEKRLRREEEQDIPEGLLTTESKSIAVAPTVESPGFVRSLENFLCELGLKVMTSPEQVAEFRRGDWNWFAKETSDAVQVLGDYLGALGKKVDYLVVPLVSDKAQSRVSTADTAASALPDIIYLRYNESLGNLHRNLTHISLVFTGDLGKIEYAYDKAFAVAYPDL